MLCIWIHVYHISSIHSMYTYVYVQLYIYIYIHIYISYSLVMLYYMHQLPKSSKYRHFSQQKCHRPLEALVSRALNPISGRFMKIKAPPVPLKVRKLICGRVAGNCGRVADICGQVAAYTLLQIHYKLKKHSFSKKALPLNLGPRNLVEGGRNAA